MDNRKGRRVLMLLENNPFQSDTRPKREARALVRSGYQVTVISPRMRGKEHYDPVEGVRLVQFAPPPPGDNLLGFVVEFSYATLVMSILALIVLFRDGVDVLHIHNPPDTFFLVAGIFKLFGKQVIYDHHDLAPEMYQARFRGTDTGNPLVRWILLTCERLTCRVADRVIATNESYKAVEMARGNVPAEQIHIVRNGPDHKKVHAVPPDDALRAKSPVLLGYIGVMGPQDGVDYLMHALHCLVYEFNRKDFLCVVIGTGSEIPRLKALTIELEIEPYVWFTGWISDEDMLRYLSTVDICVDPDPSNPFNDRSTMVKMMEYMALGKPIVAFDLPEHRVSAQGAAVYAQPNEVDDFARQIAVLIDDVERQQQMGQLGRERIETQLAWIHQERNLLEVYAELTHDAHRSASSADQGPYPRG